MNASKTLIAAIAAASIVGTVGYVSAQTSDSAAPVPQTTESMTAPATAPADMSPPPYVAPDNNTAPVTPAATDTSTPPASDPAMTTEPAPKADRN